VVGKTGPCALNGSSGSRGRPSPRAAVVSVLVRIGLLLTPALFLVAYWGMGRSRDGAEVDSGFTSRQRRVRRASQSLAVAGALQLALMLFRHSTWTIDGDELLVAAVGVGVLLVVLLWAAALPGRGLRVLLRWTALGLFGAVASGAALVRDVNQDFDFAAPAAREVRVIGMRSSATMRGGTSYYLRFEDWTGEARAREVDLSRGSTWGMRSGRDWRSRSTLGSSGSGGSGA
jgi:hypothetical protein